jgi:hypothetical protein
VISAVAHIGGQNGFGYLAAKVVIDAAIKEAEVYGIGMASVAHLNHFGVSAWVVQQAIDANMMSMVFTNSSPTMAIKSASPRSLVWVSYGLFKSGAFKIVPLTYYVYSYASEVLSLHPRNQANGLASTLHFIFNIDITEAAPSAFATIGENYYYVFVG